MALFVSSPISPSLLKFINTQSTRTLWKEIYYPHSLVYFLKINTLKLAKERDAKNDLFPRGFQRQKLPSKRKELSHCWSVSVVQSISLKSYPSFSVWIFYWGFIMETRLMNCSHGWTQSLVPSSLLEVSSLELIISCHPRGPLWITKTHPSVGKFLIFQR